MPLWLAIPEPGQESFDPLTDDHDQGDWDGDVQ
jgi:hypothetical protein